MLWRYLCFLQDKFEKFEDGLTAVTKTLRLKYKG